MLRHRNGAPRRKAPWRTVPPRWGSVLFAGGVVIAVSAGATFSTPPSAYTAAVRLLGTSIGVGGSFDGLGLTIPLFFYGTVVPQGDSFHTVPYPAQINLNYPIISDLPVLSDLPCWPQTLKRSEAVGAGYLEQDIAATQAGEMVTIIGMSQGAQVAEIARADMVKDPTYVANAQSYKFILVGDPYQPNGGILTRFTSWSERRVLGNLFPFGRPGPSDSPFQTTLYQNQYDGFADFPAYFNVLAIANAVVGIVFEHILPGYVLESPDSPNAVSTTVGNTTYVTIPQYLPLLAPLRAVVSLVGAQRFVYALDPVLRVFVEMGYDRTADPSQVKEFSWTTPPEKKREALQELPSAIEQSLAILDGATYTPTVPQPVVSATEPPTPVTEHPAQPLDTSPVAQRVRQTVVNLSEALSNLIQPVAELLQAVGGQALSQTDTQSMALTAPVVDSRLTPQVLPEGAKNVSTQAVVRAKEFPARHWPKAVRSDAPTAADPSSTNGASYTAVNAQKSTRPSTVERLIRERSDSARTGLMERRLNAISGSGNAGGSKRDAPRATAAATGPRARGRP
jgi:PE-PPE domain